MNHHPMTAGCVSPSTQRGMILVIVLWIVTLLAVLAGTFAYAMRIETRLASSTVERAQARALAEAGMVYAVAWQLDHEASRTSWPPNGDPHLWAFGGGQVQIRVSDVFGLVNLNTADAELLKTLFAGAGVEPGQQERLAETILESRQLGRSGMPSDAVFGATNSRGGFGLNKVRFESVEELQKMAGITPEIYHRIAAVLTTFSNHQGVNPELASADLLQVLGFDERTVADYIAARARAATDGADTPPLPGGGKQSFFSAAGTMKVYHIATTAETETGTTATLRVVADPRAIPSGQTMRLLSWRDGR
ncbi:MAG: hypothetical protein WBQ05_16090 [Candidatus Competibacter denitrificans]